MPSNFATRCWVLPLYLAAEVTRRIGYIVVMMRCLVRLSTGLLALASVAFPETAVIPSPESHFGHRMGADRELIEWDEVVSYFRRLETESDRIVVRELGKSTEGRPFILATIADPDTLSNLDRYREIQARLADPRRTSQEEAEALIAEGKVVVLITCSIHSDEVASTHTAVEFVYKLLTEDTSRNRRILQDTIFLLIPSLNPDGVDKVAAWYKRYLGTPYEGAPMTELYHKYTGHDNNRDWYAFTQVETRLAVEKAHNVWHPQIVYDVHQMGSQGARMFVPPWMDPIDPNIDPLIAQQVNMLGAAMAVDLTAAGKKGVVVNGIYDYFAPARHYQSYHGGMRLLSEAASVRYATPVTVPFSSLQTRGRGYNARQRSWNFLEPWPGGEWKLRDIVDYQLITFDSCLYNAALHRKELLENFYRIGRRTIEKSTPWAFVIPRSQHDANAMTRLLKILEFAMVEIDRSEEDFRATGRLFPKGDYVIRMAQPYGSFAKTLLEQQQYPDLREYPGGPPLKPYDVTAHALPLLKGVEAVRIDERVEVKLERVDKVGPQPGFVADTAVVALSPALGNSWKAVNRLLGMGAEVYRNRRNGIFYVSREGAAGELLPALADELGLVFGGWSGNPVEHQLLRRSRVGVYRGQSPIIDEGWTRWVLEEFEFPYSRLSSKRIQQGNLNQDFDVIILPDARPPTLHAGYLQGALYNGGAEVPPEYCGGIEDEGARSLRSFVDEGGTILAFNRASVYALERLNLPVRNVISGLGNEKFYAPGSLLNVTIDTSHPLCFGMRPREAVWFQSGPAFETWDMGEGRQAAAVLQFPQHDILASGWLLGQEHLSNRAAVVDVAIGRGHLVLFGIRPQYRGQSYATFKMLFNGLYYWAP